MTSRKWLCVCAALASGEYAASFMNPFAEIWPFLLGVCVLVALVGYGAEIRGWPFAAIFLLGATLFFHASVETESGFRDQPWMRGRKTWVRPEDQGNEVSGKVARIKANLLHRVGIGLEHNREVAALNRAILLGERSRLPRRTKRVFVESGTMHVFAISGLHVMTIANLLMLLLSLLYLPRRFVGLLLLPALWGYVIVIGAPPSSIRAASMASIYYLSPLFWRKPDGVTSWALTFLAVHLIDPTLITNVGCALSFTVMLAIILAGGFEAFSVTGLRKTLWVTFAAWLASVPIAAHVFGRVTPGGLLANLFLLGAAKFSVTAGASGILASFLSDTLARHLNNLSALFTETMVGIAELVSRLPGANFDVGKWSLLMCAEWYALIALVISLVYLRRRRLPF